MADHSQYPLVRLTSLICELRELKQKYKENNSFSELDQLTHSFRSLKLNSVNLKRHYHQSARVYFSLKKHSFILDQCLETIELYLHVNRNAWVVKKTTRSETKDKSYRPKKHYKSSDRGAKSSSPTRKSKRSTTTIKSKKQSSTTPRRRQQRTT